MWYNHQVMKKNEIKILIIIAIVAVLAIVGIKVYRNHISSADVSSTNDTETTSSNPNIAPTTEAKGQWVAIIHRNKVAQWFDSGENAEYTIDGDYGKMIVEVKDGSWHVEEVECPNHTCEGMGWDDGTSYMPITCIPNNILIMAQDLAENYLSTDE